MSARWWGRFGCLLAAALCLGLFVQSRKVSPDTPSSFPGYPVHERQTVGLRFSPWAEYVRAGGEMQNGEVLEASKEEWRIVWVSASWLLLAGAIGGLVGFRRLRKGKIVEDDGTW